MNALPFDRRSSVDVVPVAHAQRATRDQSAPDYPCACGAAAGEYCEVCEEIFSKPVDGDQECTCDVCTSRD